MPSINLPTRQFIKDYRLPLQATFLFILIVLILLTTRTFARLSTADILGSNTGGSNDYAAFLSKDKAEDLIKNDQSIQEVTKPVVTPTTNTTHNTESNAPTPFTITPSPPPTNTPPLPGSPPEPKEPFSAEVNQLILEGTFLECPNVSGNIEDCFKRYVFKAEIRAVNGPGNISYSWVSNLPEAIEDNSFSVGSGETFTPLYKTIILACNKPSMFTMQLKLTAPKIANSSVLEQHHGCIAPIP